ncbi:MAG TPA: TlyA family RNA methyltransferase [Candidatus Dependentiae bacterium]|nr:TlyA family RNA methyltransferase [Candidatus Dependentiae bacterium]HRQ62429.1 TlyA family RNA methyltransferase [Candidatus Dependentiae bacterium]
MAKEKKRLDHLVHELYPQYSKQQIQSWIMQGKVFVDGKKIDKPGTMLASDVTIVCHAEEPKFVSRAGFKLEKVLDHFGIDVTGLVALDAGLSTGGFTDCLLQRGIQKVYGVDVGYGQVHEKIRVDPRVVVMERINLRELPDLGDSIDLVTLDLSFISVLKVMDAVNKVIAPQGQLLVLIKPQFEARKEDVGRGGIIKDSKIHQEVVERVTQGIIAHGFNCIGVIESPILGGSGNKEFLAYFRKN